VSAHVLVPLKRLDRAKSRLAAVLSAPERSALMRSMLDGVLGAVRAAGVGRITVVTSEPIVCDDGVETWHDRDLPWNVALGVAMREVVTESVATVISADLPFVGPRDVTALIEAAPPVGIAIARAHDGGTNAVSMRPPAVLATHFGEPGSAGRHAAAARVAHVAHVVLDLPGLAFDVDTPDDLERIYERREQRHAGDLCGHRS
jgi:2-phospho-L-lactate/phosphoenolpyruvate guanylyltransferase